MRYENIINDVSTKMIETRDEFIFQTISSVVTFMFSRRPFMKL